MLTMFLDLFSSWLFLTSVSLWFNLFCIHLSITLFLTYFCSRFNNRGFAMVIISSGFYNYLLGHDFIQKEDSIFKGIFGLQPIHMTLFPVILQGRQSTPSSSSFASFSSPYFYTLMLISVPGLCLENPHSIHLSFRVIQSLLLIILSNICYPISGLYSWIVSKIDTIQSLSSLSTFIFISFITYKSILP